MTGEAFATKENWLEAGAGAFLALLEHFAANSLLCHISFFELHAAGPIARERAEAMLTLFIAFMQPHPVPPEVRARPPKVVIEAIAGGIWAVIQPRSARDGPRLCRTCCPRSSTSSCFPSGSNSVTLCGVIFRQFIHDDLGCASYFVGDRGAREVAVVDPRFEIDEYLRLARYLGVSIAHILETHNHADHVSGHGRLAAATGARIYIHEDAEAGYDHVPISDGFELEIGTATVRAMHTPGHRPEHTAFVLVDRARGEQPWAVLSGDSLFVNDIARPDLAIEPREGAARDPSLPAREADAPARHLRGLARPPRRLDVRRPRHGPQGLLDDRVRARRAIRRSRSRTRRSSSRRRPRSSAPSPPTSRRSSSSIAGR